MKNYVVSKETTLLAFLEETELTSKESKRLLSYHEVYVNGKTQTKVTYLLHIGDHVDIIPKINDTVLLLYEDRDYLAVYKPSRFYTIATEKEKEKTLYHQVSLYLKQKNKNAKVFVVHRLDFETSGIVLFAKNPQAQQKIQQHWDQEVTRKYLAIVAGKTKKKGTITLSIEELPDRVRISSNGKKAITHYQTLQQNHNFSLVEITIETGRKHQIRLSLANIGYPIIGDSKYGQPGSYFCLCAHYLEFYHPFSGKKVILSLPFLPQFDEIRKKLFL